MKVIKLEIELPNSIFKQLFKTTFFCVFYEDSEINSGKGCNRKDYYYNYFFIYKKQNKIHLNLEVLLLFIL
jgi:hypothetical protein